MDSGIAGAPRSLQSCSRETLTPKCYPGESEALSSPFPVFRVFVFLERRVLREVAQREGVFFRFAFGVEKRERV